ncbi:uncharacterized protein [Rutidosis leptorrhynchoides]|uniref:uncharacterized protein n=1 Tax=Rutidosis leptorrhynchoides TaxID=125765 RepID=UPI003A99BC9C
MKIISINIRGFAKYGAFGCVKSLCKEEKPDILAIQETKCGTVNNFWISSLWGNNTVGCVQKNSVGNSGGLIIMWNPSIFEVEDVMEKEFFLAIKGNWVHSKKETIVVNVYGPHDDAGKIRLWDSLDLVMRNLDTSWLLCVDFNEVRDEEERFNSIFIPNRASRFNNFITNNELVEIPLGGRRFTRICDNGIKMSKLDRFLAFEKFLNLWDDLSALVLDRKFSDHCPILLRDKYIDFGPKPLKFFNEWLNDDGVDKVIKDAWDIEVKGSRKDCVFRNKLKNVKNALKDWRNAKSNTLDQEIKECKVKVDKWEVLAENKVLSEQERLEWMECRKKWLSKERLKANMLRQKARIKWIVEGDENSSYFHAIIRRRYNNNNIRGLVLNGMWNENANDIMCAIHNHFESQFQKKGNNQPSMAELQYPILTSEDATNLEGPISEQ